eukprot:CAMPEP_0201906710 /NCGR_PEP_ID=MMETSP0902-20130614/57163_1 /ASSEMBLY_ACC=CAM_ASM_000551 /TAXON_ID=420261 /ORGANISM="Thalassiosira antarctica, Strain CCMP982" /LENGTH=97 /DNA_ID=CAMNT_0048440855 /DNA_START=441 /DNA_END=731 /DNA_ORIENTATION=+
MAVLRRPLRIVPMLTGKLPTFGRVEFGLDEEKRSGSGGRFGWRFWRSIDDDDDGSESGSDSESDSEEEKGEKKEAPSQELPSDKNKTSPKQTWSTSD